MPDALPLPDGLRPRGPGRRLWREVTSMFEAWRPDELVLLHQAALMCDELAELRGTRDAALRVERRAVRTELRRTLAALSLPDAAAETAEDDELQARRQSQASRRGQRAANARWARQ